MDSEERFCSCKKPEAVHCGKKRQRDDDDDCPSKDLQVVCSLYMKEGKELEARMKDEFDRGCEAQADEVAMRKRQVHLNVFMNRRAKVLFDEV
jgi:hypothetical protein